MTQDRQYPALCDQYTHLDLGLVTGLEFLGGQDGATIVLGEFRVSRVDLGLVEAGLLDAALKIVRRKDMRGASKVLEGAHMRSDPVGQALGEAGFGAGKVRVPPHCHKQMRPDQFAGLRIDEVQPVAIVHEYLLAGAVFLAHAVVALAAPTVVVLAELRIRVAVGMLFLVSMVRPAAAAASDAARCRYTRSPAPADLTPPPAP